MHLAPGHGAPARHEGPAQRRPDDTDEERERLWPRLVAIHPDFEDYRTYTGRTFPIIVRQPA